MAHIVKATLIVAKTGDTESYFERGAVLPDSVPTEERKRLAAAGLVQYVKEAPKEEPKDEGKAPSDPPKS